MRASQDAYELIKYYEGFRSEAYKCPGNVWTIGFGSTFIPIGMEDGKLRIRSVVPGDRVTEALAIQMLDVKLRDLELWMAELVEVELTQNQFDSLISFVYNVGEGNFKKSTLLKKLNQGLYKEAVHEFKRWVYAGGKILPGLERRRVSEAHLFDVGTLNFK